MATFKPCQGKSACRDNGEVCLTCGRSLSEIVQLRTHLKEITSLALEYEYENVEEFAQYIARKVEKMIIHEKSEKPLGVQLSK
ncbi:MAG: hypothetical protein K1566_03300 [Candidatus Thiodiazotropha sp. (ex. Lucinisca nassula)]|nr:hypothetical protein [Candidatus Thiodiazotropha sp. (ex. Lucinisca nassula)]MBW9268650.1 hypothetical protein [Candidatus Thiodiazotropha sp. (ex. Lucinisca nassula)]